MLNRPVFFLWISVSVIGERRFRLALPIALYPLYIIADMVEDAAILWRLFSGNRKSDAGPRLKLDDFNVEQLKNPTPEMLHVASEALRSVLTDMIFRWGAMDFVDVDVQSKREHVRVRCSLR